MGKWISVFSMYCSLKSYLNLMLKIKLIVYFVYKFLILVGFRVLVYFCFIFFGKFKVWGLELFESLFINLFGG